MLFLVNLILDGRDIVLFTRDDVGAAKTIHVSTFKHYFYACGHIPDEFHRDFEKEAPVKRRVNASTPVVQFVEQKNIQNIYSLSAPPAYGKFYKVVLDDPAEQFEVIKILQQSGMQLFEHKKITPVLRFLSDTGLCVGSWFDEVSLNSIPNVARGLPPVVSLTFDIECASVSGAFPTPEKDPVIQISCIESLGDNVVTRRLLTWRDTPEAEVYGSEEQMLLAFSRIIIKLDPDFLVTFNGDKFDNPYLIRRAEVLHLEAQFPYFSRVAGVPAIVKSLHYESDAHGSKESKIWQCDGRISADVCEFIRRNHSGSLTTFSLNACAGKFLDGEMKHDIHHSQITVHWNGTVDQRHRLARYCLKDADLTFRLAVQLRIFSSIFSMCRASHCDPKTYVTGGQQITTSALIAHYAHQQGFVCPFASKKDNQPSAYIGALVLEPEPGFYKDFAACLDFSSLYPSIIIAWNLCYTTYIPPHKLKDFGPHQYYTAPSGDSFLTAKERKGVVPTLLEALLAARGAAKRSMATAATEDEKNYYNGLQDAIKRKANSVYGYTGAGEFGHLSAVYIGRSTTTIGRECLQKVIDWVKTNAPGKPVLYGDTDSVFVYCPGMNKEQTWTFMHETAARITTELFGERKPMSLAPEKVCGPLLFEGKKRYICMVTMGSLQAKPKLLAKGIELVRRDWCAYTQAIMQRLVDMLLVEFAPKTEIDRYLRAQITDLYAGNVSLSQLLLTANLTKDPDKYKTPTRHTTLVTKMQQRDPGTAPQAGERVVFLMVNDSGSKEAADQSEDPLIVIAQNRPLNYDYYVTKQIRAPVERLLTPWCKDEEWVKSLFAGHTARKQQLPTVARPGTLLRWVHTVQRPCRLCKAPTANAQFCETCSTNTDGIAAFKAKQAADLVDLEDVVRQNREKCWKCQQIAPGSEIICSARDCKHLYVRTANEHRLKNVFL